MKTIKKFFIALDIALLISYMLVPIAVLLLIGILMVGAGQLVPLNDFIFIFLFVPFIVYYFIYMTEEVKKSINQFKSV